MDELPMIIFGKGPLRISISKSHYILLNIAKGQHLLTNTAKDQHGKDLTYIYHGTVYNRGLSQNKIEKITRQNRKIDFTAHITLV
jgi:hypothetical protein